MLISGSRRIGFIADSHGSLSALRCGIDSLISMKCDAIVHLGDFCDSVHLEELGAIFDLLQESGIQVIKGNNDYQVEKMLRSGYSNHGVDEKRRWLSFLDKTPIMREWKNLCFAHSMPFDSIRSFYEPVDTGATDRAREIFAATEYRSLFCGHSHVPVFFRHRAGRVTRESMTAGRPVGINSLERYIFIIGSAVNGEYGIFDMERSQYKRLTL